MKKFDSTELEKAKEEAKTLSESSNDNYACVIESQGSYYVDTCSFVRAWEKLVCEYDGGRLLT